MKLLYGVQATGNGHITRARALNHHLKALGIEVDFLFSGREKADFFDMDEFGQWRCHQGLTFVHEAGDLKIFRTMQKNSLLRLVKDIKALDLQQYDLVLSDFEPITAWAARLKGKPSVGVGHQYAFHHDIPKRGDTLLASAIMRHFAPVDLGLGLHWHHFGQPILPPIAETHATTTLSDPNKIVVYLGFEAVDDVITLLEPFDSHLFVFYGPFAQYESRGHIQLKPLSREGFKQDLATAGGVICNAGFELSSEAIQLGKKLLVKPLKGQMEQLSNGLALEKLGLGKVMDTLDPDAVRHWLDGPSGKQVIYPNVAAAIASWIHQGQWQQPGALETLAAKLWRETQASGAPTIDERPPVFQNTATAAVTAGEACMNVRVEERL